MRTVHLTGTILLLLVLLFCRLDGASAQGSDAARQACTPDAMRLCSDVIPDVARVTGTITGVTTIIITIDVIAADLGKCINGAWCELVACKGPQPYATAGRRRY